MGAFLLFTAGLSLLGHALLYGWARRTFPWVARHRRLTLAVSSALALAPPLSRALATLLHSAWLGRFAMFFTVETLTVLIGALLTALATGVVAALRGTARLARREPTNVASSEVALPPVEPTPTESPVPAVIPTAEVGRRVAIERGLGLAAYGAVGSMLGWGMVRGRHDYTVEELVVRVPGLSPKLEGYTIAQISDLHAGILIDEAEFDRGFAPLRALKPDLVVATGDLVDHDAGFAPMIARKLAELGARDGTLAILGNHDYYAGASRVQQAMTRAGVGLLINESRHLQKDAGSGLVVLGMDDFAGQRFLGRGPDLYGTIQRLSPEAKDAPRIVLAHQPPFFDEMAGQAALQLSGHTHGGQINLAGIQSAKLVGMRYVAGRYTRGESSLWVNRGFGVAGPPTRVGAPPEITKIVLVAG